MRPLPTTFAVECLGVPAVQPTGRDIFAGTAPCCVCGAPADKDGVPWLRARALSDSFGPLESYAEPESHAACGACIHMSVGATFHAAAAGREPPVKLWPQASWRSYSHIFTRVGHTIPRAADWRSLLACPPQAPFLAVWTATGKKNLIFRATVAVDRDLFPILAEETTVWVDRVVAARMLADVEAALAAGFSRESVASGRYPSAACMRSGLATWRRLEAPLAAHRKVRQPLLRLASAIAYREASTTAQEKAA